MNGASEQKLLVKLREILSACFDEEELRDLCFDMNIPYGDLPGSKTSSKARELVSYCSRRGRISELEEKIAQLRPHLLGSSSAEQPDIIRELLKRTDPNHIRYQNIIIYLDGLGNKIMQARSRGDTTSLQAGSNRIENQLRKGTLSALNMPLTELGAQIDAAKEQVISEPSSQIIRDPLSLVDLRSEVGTGHTLEEMQEAWRSSNWGEVVRLCDEVIDCESNCPDQSANTTAQLYKADALVQSGQLQKGIYLAKRARSNFSIQGDHRHEIVANLFLTRWEAGQSLDDARRSYKAISQRCEELKSKAAEDIEYRFFEQIIGDIAQTLSNLGQALPKEQCQSCTLNAIPILQPSDGLDMISKPAKVINYLTTDKFRIEGDRFTYLVYPLDKQKNKKLELMVGAVHFALPVPVNGWPTSFSKQGQDYVLVRAPDTHEGPGVRWTGQEWSMGKFERDATTKEIYFVRQIQPRTIGEGVIKQEKGPIKIERGIIPREYGLVIGLLKPEASTRIPTAL